MTAEVPLSRSLVALVDDEDLPRVLAAGKWSAYAAPHTFYAVRAIVRPDGVRSIIRLHTLLTEWPLVDHANGDGLDNTRSNLRPATKAQNACNSRRRSDNHSGFTGVTWTPTNRRWRALIHAGGRRLHLGYFDSPTEAAAAYDAAATDLHGDFATLNLPKEQSA